jgi:magnesium-transporting ATPase (P-type)
MASSRTQKNKAHKTRFSSKSSRNIHKESTGKLTLLFFYCLFSGLILVRVLHSGEFFRRSSVCWPMGHVNFASDHLHAEILGKFLPFQLISVISTFLIMTDSGFFFSSILSWDFSYAFKWMISLKFCAFRQFFLFFPGGTSEFHAIPIEPMFISFPPYHGETFWCWCIWLVRTVSCTRCPVCCLCVWNTKACFLPSWSICIPNHLVFIIFL